MYIINLADFMLQLLDNKIVPKKIIYPSYTISFQMALWFANHWYLDKEFVKDIIEFCDKQKIEEIIPPEAVLNALQERGDVFRSFDIPTDPNTPADMYQCTKCKKFFDTSKKLEAHLKTQTNGGKIPKLNP